MEIKSMKWNVDNFLTKSLFLNPIKNPILLNSVPLSQKNKWTHILKSANNQLIKLNV